MEEFVRQARTDGGLIAVMSRYYGPYILLLFDMTVAIIAMMSVLFVVGWLRHTGELTSTLAAGISHGRILRPMVIGSALLMGFQFVNREFLLPDMRDALSMKPRDLTGDAEQPILPNFDKTSAILFGGKSLKPRSKVLIQPVFDLDANYQGYGDTLAAAKAVWLPKDDRHEAGFLLQDVQQPKNINALPSIGTKTRHILMSPRDHQWIEPGQLFVVTSVTTDMLATSGSSTKLSSIVQLARRVKNPAVDTSSSVQTFLHERVIRTPLDFCLVLLGLPLVVNRKGKNLFMLIGIAVGTVLGFFFVKTLAGALGSNGYLLTPAMAAWLPLLLVGPIGYARLREVQTV